MKHNTKPNNMKINKAKKYKKLMVTRTMCLDCLSCALIVIFALRRSHFFVLFCFVFFVWLAKQWVSLELFTKRIGSSWISHFFFYLAIGRFYARDVKVV